MGSVARAQGYKATVSRSALVPVLRLHYILLVRSACSHPSRPQHLLGIHGHPDWDEPRC